MKASARRRRGRVVLGAGCCPLTSCPALGCPFTLPSTWLSEPLPVCPPHPPQEEALAQVQGILGCSTTTARTLLIFFSWDAEAVLGGCWAGVPGRVGRALARLQHHAKGVVSLLPAHLATPCPAATCPRSTPSRSLLPLARHHRGAGAGGGVQAGGPAEPLGRRHCSVRGAQRRGRAGLHGLHVRRGARRRHHHGLRPHLLQRLLASAHAVGAQGQRGGRAAAGAARRCHPSATHPPTPQTQHPTSTCSITISEGMSRRLRCMAPGCGVVCDEDKVRWGVGVGAGAGIPRPP